MSAPSWMDNEQAISTVFSRGTRRQELPVSDSFVSGQLAVLAAVASRGRFDLPAVPDEFEHHTSSVDPAFMANGAVRAAMLRYFRSTRDRIPANAPFRVFSLFRKAGLNVHPFDYVKLRHLANFDALLFDTTFRQWVGEKPATQMSAEITAENWLDYGTAERRDFIRALHLRDAETARSLLVDALPNETASVRGKLIMAIESSVTKDDQQFLQSLLSDRAKSVKDLVTVLLSGLPGSDQNKERLGEAVSRLSVSKSGITRKRKLLVEQPMGLKKNSRKLDEWYDLTFNGLDPVALACRLDVEPATFCDLIEQPNLAFQSVLQLARQGHSDFMVRLVKRFPDAVLHLLANESELSLQALSADTKHALWDVLVRETSRKDISDWIAYLDYVYAVLQAPMSAQTSIFILEEKRFILALKDATGEGCGASDDHHLIEKLAIALDVASYAKLTEITSDASPMFISHANQLMGLLELLEVQAQTQSNGEK